MVCDGSQSSCGGCFIDVQNGVGVVFFEDG